MGHFKIYRLSATRNLRIKASKSIELIDDVDDGNAQNFTISTKRFTDNE